MFAKTRVRIFWIERVDQQRVLLRDRTCRFAWGQLRRYHHVLWNPVLPHRALSIVFGSRGDNVSSLRYGVRCPLAERKLV